MPTFYVDEAAFVLPEKGFVDRTIHRLDLKGVFLAALAEDFDGDHAAAFFCLRSACS